MHLNIVNFLTAEVQSLSKLFSRVLALRRELVERGSTTKSLGKRPVLKEEERAALRQKAGQGEGKEVERVFQETLGFLPGLRKNEKEKEEEEKKEKEEEEEEKKQASHHNPPSTVDSTDSEDEFEVARLEGMERVLGDIVDMTSQLSFLLVEQSPVLLELHENAKETSEQVEEAKGQIARTLERVRKSSTGAMVTAVLAAALLLLDFLYS